MTGSSLRRILVAWCALALLALSALTPAAAATLTPPPPADARCEAVGRQTICFWIDLNFRTPGPVPYGVTCDGFSVLVDLRGERRFKATYDADGTLVLSVRHVSYVGTLSNSLTGAAVPHEGHFTVTDDPAAGTSTVTGMLSRTSLPGEGVIWRNVGKLVLGSTGVVFDAGDHEFFTFVAGDAGVAERLCAALA